VAVDAQAVVQAQGAVDLASSTRQLDSDTLSAAVAVASAQVQLAQANQAVGAVPPSAATVAADQANVAKDNAAVAADQVAITASTITAPADGIVGSVGGVVGDVASQDGVRNFTLSSSIPQAASSGIQIFPQAPTQSTSQPAAYNPAVTLDSTQVKVVAQISETDVQSLRANQQATITIPALSGTSLHASVERVEPQPVNQGGKVYFVIDLRLSSAPSEIGATQQVSLARADGSTTSWNLVGLTADISL
jgi:multidrug resistance efflux pump